MIRRSIRYPESAERGVSILDYRPELGGDYIRLADELLARLGDDEARERLARCAKRWSRPGRSRPVRQTPHSVACPKLSPE